MTINQSFFFQIIQRQLVQGEGPDVTERLPVRLRPLAEYHVEVHRHGRARVSSPPGSRMEHGC